MKKNFIAILLAVASIASLSSCRPDLKSESGLYSVPLTHTIKADVDGFWISDKPNPYAKQRSGNIYMAPLNVDIMRKEYPELASLLVQQMQGHMTNSMAHTLVKMNKESHLNWNITKVPSRADVIIKMAVVKFKPQRPLLKIFNSIGGLFIDIPGVSNVVGKFTNGDICVEGVFVDAHTGKVMAAFKDSNRKTTRLYRKNAYEKLGQADQNMQLWAERIAKVIYATHFDAQGRVTLQQEIKDRNVGDIIKLKADSAL